MGEEKEGVSLSCVMKQTVKKFGKSRKTLAERSDEEKAAYARISNDAAEQTKLVEQVKEKLLELGEDEEALEGLRDDLILQCLRVRRFAFNEGFELVTQFIKFRRTNGWPLSFNEGDVDDIKDTKAHEILEERDQDDRPIVTMAAGKLDLKSHKAIEYHKLASYCLEILTRGNIDFIDNGISLVLDLKGLKMKTFTMLKNSDLSRGLEIFTKFPIKVKRVYIINSGFVFNATIRTGLLLVPAARAVVKVTSEKDFRAQLQSSSKKQLEQLEEPQHSPGTKQKIIPAQTA